MSFPLKALTSDAGTESLSRSAGGASPEALARIRELVKNQLAKHPELKDIQVQPRENFNNASYRFTDQTLTSGLADPDVIAHELGHAQNLHDAPVYQKLLLAAKGLAAINQRAAVPVMLGLRAFVSDPHKRDDILSTLAGLSVATAAPGLLEEASASANAIINSDDKLRTAKRLVPALGSHAVHDLIPALLYQIDRRF